MGVLTKAILINIQGELRPPPSTERFSGPTAWVILLPV